MTEHPRPLVVGLDGTLVRTSTVVEIWLGAVRSRPGLLVISPFWLIRGLGHFKERLAEHADLAPECLPYHAGVVDYLREQRTAGRPVHLATSAPRAIADGVARHLGLFDRVYASDPLNHLGGRTKAERLAQDFGEGGFTYVGHDGEDAALWQAAGSAVLVSGSAGGTSRVGLPIEAEFSGQKTPVRALLRALRSYQWVKNVLVFLPLITANGLGRGESLLAAVGTFAAFSCLASGVYVVNDLFDLEADRRHPLKRSRPFASGEAPVAWGVVLGPLLMATGVAAGFLLGFWVGVSLVFYAAITVAYSAYLKTQPLVDVFTLALLYTLRIVAGGAAVGEPASIWLLSFSSFFFLSLGFLKRHVELSGADVEAGVHRRGYDLGEDRPLLVMGIASSFAASIVLALYVDTSVAETIYARPEAIWAFVPLSLFWQMRMWLAAERGFVSGDPITYAARDWVSLLVVLVGVAFYVAAAA